VEKPMKKEKILFVCVHNSARSQMAEAFMNSLCGDRFEAKSAGLEPGTLNPLVVKVMGEAGMDISRNKTKSVFDFFKSGELFARVVTVCDEVSAERCPVFPGISERLHWGFPDPSALSGTMEEQMAAVRKIRDDIKNRIIAYCSERRTQ
jgi:arsenate reductase